jgi:hypothetical protein
MKKLIIILLLFSSQLMAQTADFTVFNRTITGNSENGKSFIRFSEGKAEGLAWANGKTFSEGTIEFDTRGRDKFQGSFIGVAFHAQNDSTYEAIYFRPFNFQATDPVRHIHAVQYIFHPKYTWKMLRETRNGEFEKEIIPADLQPNDWFHAKVEVRNGRIKVFVNDSEKPCLDVPTLNPTGKSGKIGFWVGDGSNGDFANLKFY